MNWLGRFSDILSGSKILWAKVNALDSRIAQLDSKTGQLDSRIDQLDSRIDALDSKVDALGSSLNARIDALGSGLNARIDALDSKLGSRVDELFGIVSHNSASIARLEINFKNVHEGSSNKIKESNSPFVLNKLGKEYAEYLGVAEWVDNVVSKIPKEDHMKEDYLLHDYASDYAFGYYIMGRHSDDMKEKFRRIAYEKGITESEVYGILSISLREKLIESKEAMQQNNFESGKYASKD